MNEIFKNQRIFIFSGTRASSGFDHMSWCKAGTVLQLLDQKIFILSHKKGQIAGGSFHIVALCENALPSQSDLARRMSSPGLAALPFD